MENDTPLPEIVAALAAIDRWKTAIDKNEPPHESDQKVAASIDEGFEQWLRSCVEEIERWKKAFDDEDRSHGITIEERDKREKQITEIARILGVTSEWSNLHDLGEEAKEKATALARENAKMRDLLWSAREAMENKCGWSGHVSMIRKIDAALQPGAGEGE